MHDVSWTMGGLHRFRELPGLPTFGMSLTRGTVLVRHALHVCTSGALIICLRAERDWIALPRL